MFSTEHFRLVDDNFPECGIDCSDWIEKFYNVFSLFKNDSFTRIAILSEKNVFSVSAIHAATQLELPYVPIDVNSPPARIQNILTQLEPEIYFIQKKVVDTKSESFSNLHTIWESNNFLIAKSTTKSKISHPSELAFLLFTSGSTGTPKGVMISKTNANCFVDWTINEFQINKESKILSVAPLHFDLSVFDLFATSKTSAAIFLPLQNSLMNPLYLAELISIYKINTIYATPTWFSLLMEYGKMKRFDYSYVKTILLAGEALHVNTIEKLHKYFPNANFANLYGPTETNVCSFYKIDFATTIENQKEIVSIGKACPYAQLQLNAENVLEIAGESVMLGYWPNTNSQEWYNSGDIVSQDATTKNYFYVERADRMIKRHGYRIEPAEIESIISTHPNILQVAIIAKKENENTSIIAHYTSKMRTEIDDIHQHCVSNLTSYMIPDKFILHSQLPLTSSGKTDYKKLAEL